MYPEVRSLYYLLEKKKSKHKVEPNAVMKNIEEWQQKNVYIALYRQKER